MATKREEEALVLFNVIQKLKTINPLEVVRAVTEICEHYDNQDGENPCDKCRLTPCGAATSPYRKLINAAQEMDYALHNFIHYLKHVREGVIADDNKS